MIVAITSQVGRAVVVRLHIIVIDEYDSVYCATVLTEVPMCATMYVQ